MLALAAVLVGAAAVAVSVAAVARPTSASVQQADAVFVHAGREARLDAALALVAGGAAPVLVISDVERGYGRSRSLLAELCGQQEPYEVVCVPPDPVDTRGEARAFGRLAGERGWQRVAVLTSRDHLARASGAVRQCTDAEVLAVAADPHARPRAGKVAGEWLRLAATLTAVRAC